MLLVARSNTGLNQIIKHHVKAIMQTLMHAWGKNALKSIKGKCHQTWTSNQRVSCRLMPPGGAPSGVSRWVALCNGGMAATNCSN